MEIEKEYRYKVTDEQIQRIKQISNVIDEKSEQIDLTLGYDGFNSLNKYGYVCRVRKKANKIWMEVKKKQEEGFFYETKIELNSFKDGVDFCSFLGMKAYMYSKKTREILDYKGLKIFIDDIDLLGKYIEIEFQDVDNPNELIKEFMEKTLIEDIKQPLYGDILNKLINEDKEFKEKFEKGILQFMSKI